MALQFLIDTVQTRLSEDSLSTLVTGLDWDLTQSTNVYIDGVTNTVMLTPAFKQAGWTTTTTGIYTKFNRSNFTLGDSGNWEDNNFDTGGPFMHYKAAGGNVSGIGGTCLTTPPVNQPMVVEWFNPGASPNINGVMECGWGDPATGVSLRFYADGRAEVWLADVLQGQYSMSGKSQTYYEPQAGQIIPNAPTGQYVGVMLIPCRGRELLVIGSTGGGFSHIFSGIPEGTVSPTIVDGQPFFFNVPPTTEANVRISQLQFASSGTAIGVRSYWRYELPVGSAVSTQLYQDPDQPQATGTYVDGLNPANPYVNNTNGVRLSVALAGGPTQTSFVYGGRCYTEPKTEPTFGASVDVAKFVLAMGIDISDNVSGVAGHVQLMGPDAIATAGVPDIESQTHRPAQILMGSQILESVLVRPKWVDASGFDDAGKDLNKDIEIEVKDLWVLAEDYQFSDPIPLDGMPLDDAYELIADTAGFTANVSSSYHTFLLPSAGAPTGGKFNVAVKAGDKCSEWLDRLHKTYAGTDYHGVSPTGVFEMLPLAELPTTPVMTLYETMDLASAAGVPDTDLGKSVFRTYDEQILEPEANDVYVIGMDFRSQRPLVFHKRDAASADPTVSPGLRPNNWLGFLRKYGWVDPTITTQGAGTYCMDLLYNRLTPVRQLGEFECEYIVGATRKDLVTLNFVDGTIKTGRIKTISMNSTNEDTRFTVWRPARYVIQLGGDPSPTNTHGTRLKGISHEWATRAASKSAIWGHIPIDQWIRPSIAVFEL